MAANPDRKIRSLSSGADPASSPASAESRKNGFGPQAVNAFSFASDLGRFELRAYTEEQVADMLQVSRSQLRKWRMGWSRGRRDGPPFKKLGRIVRYPESGLRAYIYGA